MIALLDHVDGSTRIMEDDVASGQTTRPITYISMNDILDYVRSCFEGSIVSRPW